MRIDSVKALRCILVGTRLRVVREGRNAVPPSGRVVKRAEAREVVLTIDDPSNPFHGQEALIELEYATGVASTDRGFVVYYDGGGVLEYEFTG